MKQITSYLDDAETIGNPYPLLQNAGKSFQGSIVLGKGFILEPKEAMNLIEKNLKNKDVLFPYLNGEDLNKNPDQSPSRWVINFFDWPEEKCRKEYPDCFEIVERLVKPERLEYDENKNSWNYSVKKFWWQFGAWRKGLEEAIKPLERVLAISRVSKYLLCSLTKHIYVFADQTFAIAYEKYYYFSIIQSNIHDSWTWKTCSTMGSGLRYTASSAFETFPFPQNASPEIKEQIELTGEKYHAHRRQLMLKMKLGLTKSYNQFHNPNLRAFSNDDIATISNLKAKEFQKQYGKETVNLWKHIEKTEGVCTFNEAIHDILHLRELHKQMDETVLKAYGWEDIDLAHDFYEVDYLPENDRVRYTISPDARKEVLKRLLKLNHEIHEQEVKAGLHAKGKTKKKQKADASKQIKLF